MEVYFYRPSNTEISFVCARSNIWSEYFDEFVELLATFEYRENRPVFGRNSEFSCALYVSWPLPDRTRVQVMMYIRRYHSRKLRGQFVRPKNLEMERGRKETLGEIPREIPGEILCDTFMTSTASPDHVGTFVSMKYTEVYLFHRITSSPPPSVVTTFFL